MVYEQKVKFTVGLWTYGPLCHVPQIPYLPQVQLGPNLVELVTALEVWLWHNDSLKNDCVLRTEEGAISDSNVFCEIIKFVYQMSFCRGHGMGGFEVAKM